MQRILIKETIDKIGEEITLCGWVDARRDHGKLIFIDLRDISGLIQIVFLPSDKELHQKAEKLRSEWVIQIKGIINKRPDNMVNNELLTGQIEILVKELEILSEAKTLPFELDKTAEVGEEMRLKYRYLDLRAKKMAENIKLRSKINQFCRNYLIDKGFVEIETPVLTKSTPEGARDYVVPSRLHTGQFYALPQSPQQYKQLLMVAGFEKYFQIAKCFRDEDTRGDRQPEFTQLDMEMSFAKQEEIMELNEKLLITIIRELIPEKEIQEIPFPVLSYKEAMEKYGTDRPDLRKDKNDENLLAFCWVIDFPFFKEVEASAAHAEASAKSASHSEASAKEWTFTHNPFSAPKPEYRESLLKKENISEILASQYDVVLNGFEIGGGSIRNNQREDLQAVFEIIGYEKERIDRNFGHILEAFEYGAPPHGGIAWGLDRVLAILTDSPNIREVIAFPKTGDGRDLMMDAPAEIEQGQLKELHIKIDK